MKVLKNVTINETLNVLGAVDLDSTLVVGGNIEASTVVQTTLTGNALRVLRNLTSTNTDSPLVELVQDHASDDQPALKIQQDATGSNVSALDIICANVTYQLMRSAGVAHGMTGIVPTDVLARINAASLTAGGVTLRGFTDSDAIPLWLIGTSGSAAPTVASVMILGQKYDGATGATTLAATEPLLDIATNSSVPLARFMGDGSLSLGSGASPNARLEVNGTGVTSALRLIGTTSGDDPYMDFRTPNRGTTTNATLTTFFAIAIPTDTVCYLEVVIMARRTGGSAGTAGDSALYHRKAGYTNKAGTVALLGGSLMESIDREDNAAWDCQLNISGTDVLVQVQGATNNTITWHRIECKFSSLNT